MSIMRRERVDKIFDSATSSKLVYVIAGAGYGKTQAVRSYIEQQKDCVVRWMQLHDSDNIGSRYWENLTHNVSADNPELARQLREFGFPDSSARFRHFAEILKSAEHRSRKTFLVLDDFHLINSKQALMFAQRCAHLEIPGACVIIISRTEPEINTVSLFAKGQVSIVTEDELRFTTDEIDRFTGNYGMSCTAQDLSKIAGATGGWALALQLFLFVVSKNRGDIDAALITMKQNIHKIMETEAWDNFPDDIQRTLARLSLVSDLPLKVLREHFDDTGFMSQAPQLTSFVWHDSFTGQYRVHPLYWEFLQSKQGILTESEKQETFCTAAQWCRENSFYLDAVKYMAASRRFADFLSVLLTYPVRLPRDMCRYFCETIKGLAPNVQEQQDINYLLLANLFAPLMQMGAGDYDGAREMCLEAVSQWEMTKTSVSSFMLSIAYSNLTYIDMYSCTTTHQYTAAQHIRKAVEYQKNSPAPSVQISGAFDIADVRSFACLVGVEATLQEFDEFLEMTKEIERYIVVTSHYMYHGYTELAACEIEFHKNHLRRAKAYAHEAIIKAREKDQYSIEAMAAMYLFRIAIAEGDYQAVKELFRQRNSSPDTPYFWNRQFLYELGISFIYAQIGLKGMLPAWISSDEKEAAHETSVPVRETICTARLLISLKQYDRALILLGGAYPRARHKQYLFGELTLLLLSAAAKIRTGDTDGAINDFVKAYRLSFDGLFEFPFIELGRDVYPLFEAVMPAAEQYGISADKLNKIKYKVTIYIKKAAIVFDSFKQDEHIEDSVRLSQRETDVLLDLYHGLSREEIATNRYLSINTVHKIIQSVFLKLDASNKADAIRIAVDKHII